MRTLITTALMALLVSSCVWKSDYDALKAENEKLKELNKNFEDFNFTPPTEDQTKAFENAISFMQGNRDVHQGLGTRVTVQDVINDTTEFGKFKRYLTPFMKSYGVYISSSYTFGWKEMQSLVNDVKMLHGINKKFAGIGVHHGIDTTDTGYPYVSVFLSPVDSLGKPIFSHPRISYRDIQKDGFPKQGGGSESGSLDRSNPCPDYCP